MVALKDSDGVCTNQWEADTVISVYSLFGAEDSLPAGKALANMHVDMHGGRRAPTTLLYYASSAEFARRFACCSAESIRRPCAQTFIKRAST